MCGRRVERREDDCIMQVLIRVQTKWRVRQPTSATMEDIVWCVLVPHPHELDTSEDLLHSLDDAIPHRLHTTDRLVAKVLRPVFLSGIADGQQFSITVTGVPQSLGDGLVWAEPDVRR